MTDLQAKPKLNVVGVSGGKDSTTTAILALEEKTPAVFLFADTGNEHPKTYEYLSYLECALDIKIERLRPDFSRQIERKKEVVRNKWVTEGAVTPDQAEKICALLKPTGNPFLDLCIWKGRFPSSRARFCSEELKHFPLDMRMLELAKDYDIVSWQGVRADESPSRAKLPERERGDFYEIYRPILKWSAEQVFEKHRAAGILPNPLYKAGMQRVGCMPCIHSRKSEIHEIAARFPEEVERIAEWERIVSQVSKLGNPTFFHASTDPTISTKDNAKISTESHGIHRIVEWSHTARGGRQLDLIASTEEPMLCSSAYGLCE